MVGEVASPERGSCPVFPVQIPVGAGRGPPRRPRTFEGLSPWGGTLRPVVTAPETFRKTFQPRLSQSPGWGLGDGDWHCFLSREAALCGSMMWLWQPRPPPCSLAAPGSLKCLLTSDTSFTPAPADNLWSDDFGGSVCVCVFHWWPECQNTVSFLRKTFSKMFGRLLQTAVVAGAGEHPHDCSWLSRLIVLPAELRDYGESLRSPGRKGWGSDYDSKEHWRHILL